MNKVLIAVSILIAVALAEQTSHQSIRHGNRQVVSHGVNHGQHPRVVPSSYRTPTVYKKPAPVVYNKPTTYSRPAPVVYNKPTTYSRPAPVVYNKPATYSRPAPVAYSKPATYSRPAPVVYSKPATYSRPAPVVYSKPAAPTYRPASTHHKRNPDPAYGNAPPVYQYDYSVVDEQAGVKFSANENRDNDGTKGEYHVALPDGHTQVVTYNVADAYSGYVANVEYHGVHG